MSTCIAGVPATFVSRSPITATSSEQSTPRGGAGPWSGATERGSEAEEHRRADQGSRGSHPRAAERQNYSPPLRGCSASVAGATTLRVGVAASVAGAAALRAGAIASVAGATALGAGATAGVAASEAGCSTPGAGLTCPSSSEAPHASRWLTCTVGSRPALEPRSGGAKRRSTGVKNRVDRAPAHAAGGSAMNTEGRQ